MAKSTIVVVPPWAAAIVPVSKSSTERVPPKGMSRCVCTSMPPGITSILRASITRAPLASSSVPMAEITWPSISTSPA